MNVTVIKLKDLVKYLVVSGMTLLVIFGTTSFLNRENKENDVKNIFSEIISKIQKFSMTYIINLTIPVTNINENSIDNIDNKQSLGLKILDSNLHIAKNIKENSNDEIIDDKVEELTNIKSEPEKIELAKTDVTTQEVEENNIKPSYTDIHKDIQIKNQSSHDITEDLFEEEYEFKNTKEVLIYHTHTCESYTPTDNFNYEMTGSYRTTDLEYSVARVGDELEKQLGEYGYNVTHDKTYHDYPAYNGSYDRSQETVKGILNENPDIQTAIDLHRDAVGSNSDYAPSVLIDGESAAQLMLVIRYRWRGIMASKLETKL